MKTKKQIDDIWIPDMTKEELNYIIDNFKKNPYYYESDETYFGSIDDVRITVGYMKSLIRDQKINLILNDTTTN